MALVLGRPRRAGWLAVLATVASVAGGALGYGMGAYLFEPVAAPLLARFGAAGSFGTLQTAYRENLFWALATSGYTPIPYLLYTSAAGALGVPLLPFLAYSLVGRGLKYGVIGGLAYVLGPAVRPVLKRLPRVALAMVVLVLLAWWAARL